MSTDSDSKSIRLPLKQWIKIIPHIWYNKDSIQRIFLSRSWAEVQISCWHFCSHIRSCYLDPVEVLTTQTMPAHQNDLFAASREARAEKSACAPSFASKFTIFDFMREALRKFAFICVAINHAELAQISNSAIREEGGCRVHIYYFFLAI